MWRFVIGKLKITQDQQSTWDWKSITSRAKDFCCLCWYWKWKEDIRTPKVTLRAIVQNINFSVGSNYLLSLIVSWKVRTRETLWCNEGVGRRFVEVEIEIEWSVPCRRKTWECCDGNRERSVRQQTASIKTLNRVFETSLSVQQSYGTHQHPASRVRLKVSKRFEKRNQWQRHLA